MDFHKQIWLEMIKMHQYEEGLKERCKIERKFLEAKQGYGFSRYCYIEKFTMLFNLFL
jgi:hypothetical protein